MKKFKKKKGLTLIELLVSIALIAIIAVSFLSMFVTGFKFIANAGNKTKVMYASQDEAEKKLLEGASAASFHMTVKFPAHDTEPAIDVPMDGEKVIKGSITLFIPM